MKLVVFHTIFLIFSYLKKSFPLNLEVALIRNKNRKKVSNIFTLPKKQKVFGYSTTAGESWMNNIRSKANLWLLAFLFFAMVDTRPAFQKVHAFILSLIFWRVNFA